MCKGTTVNGSKVPMDLPVGTVLALAPNVPSILRVYLHLDLQASVERIFSFCLMLIGRQYQEPSSTVTCKVA